MPILTIQVTTKQYRWLQSQKISENRPLAWLVRDALKTYIHSHYPTCKSPTCKPPTCKQHTSTTFPYFSLHTKSHTLPRVGITSSLPISKKKKNIYIQGRSARPDRKRRGAEQLDNHVLKWLKYKTDSTAALIMPLLGHAHTPSPLLKRTKGLVSKLLKKGATPPDIVSVVKWALEWMGTPRIEVMLKLENYTNYVINASINPPKPERPAAGLSPYIEDKPVDMPSPDEQRFALRRLMAKVGIPLGEHA